MVTLLCSEVIFSIMEKLEMAKKNWKRAICFPAETEKLLPFEFIPFNFDKR